MRRLFILLILCCLIILFLSACGGSSFTQPTPTPLPTSSLPGLVTVQPQMCELAKLSMLRVDAPQGDLLAWAPDSNTLAYLVPAPGSTWMVGNLTTVTAPNFDDPQKLASYAAGQLTWSPQGTALAYLFLRRSDTLYSIGVVYPGLDQLVDLFPGEAARTDEWGSQKAILGWDSPTRLRLQVSCGLDCIQTLRAVLPDGTLTPLGDPQQRPWDWWDYHLNPGTALPDGYAEFAQQVNWSPDGQRLVYLDPRRDAWVISLDDQTQYPLPTGGYLAVSETDWSSDGAYLAVQAEDWLFIFGDCK